MNNPILIAEDEASFRRIYRDVLESQGFTVIEAVDGQAAIEMAKQHQPALILLDIIMPKKDGYAVLTELRADPATRAIPVIMFSVLGEKTDVSKGLQLGANDYAMKGMTTPREIIQKVRTLLNQPAAKLQEPPAPDIYHLRIMPTKGDAVIFQKDLDLDKSFDCPKCGNELNLELQRATDRQPGHWYVGHMVCPGCKNEI